MFEQVTEKPSRWRGLWPEVADLDSARSASRQGMWAALFVAVVTAAVAAFKAFGLSTSAFFDAAVFFGIAWGIYRVSRVAAAAGLLLYVLERVVTFAQSHETGGILAIFLLLAFGNGARGAFAYRRLLKQSTGGVGSQT